MAIVSRTAKSVRPPRPSRLDSLHMRSLYDALSVVPDPKVAPVARRRGASQLLFCLGPCVALLREQLVGEVVLVDVRHVLHGFAADGLPRNDLDIVEPLVRIQPALL